MRKGKRGPGDGDYPVGYGKPPAATRFKPGQSGNPRGRPKGKLSRGTVFERILQERVVITENGRRRSITKLEAVFKQAVNKAAAGHDKAQQNVFSLMQHYDGADVLQNDNALIDAVTDEKVFGDVLARLAGTSAASEAPTPEAAVSDAATTPGDDHEPDAG